MALKISFSIPDKYLPSLDQRLASLVVTTVDPDTGAVVETPIFASPEDYFYSIMAEELARLAKNYPSGETLTKIATIETLRQEVENDRPSKVELTPE